MRSFVTGLAAPVLTIHGFATFIFLTILAAGNGGQDSNMGVTISTRVITNTYEQG